MVDDEREQLRLQIEELRLQAISGLEQLVEALYKISSVSEMPDTPGLPGLNPIFMVAAPLQIAYAREGRFLVAPPETVEIWSVPGSPDDGEGGRKV